MINMSDVCTRMIIMIISDHTTEHDIQLIEAHNKNILGRIEKLKITSLRYQRERTRTCCERVGGLVDVNRANIREFCHAYTLYENDDRKSSVNVYVIW